MNRQLGLCSNKKPPAEAEGRWPVVACLIFVE